jgi:hypothetical protein
MEKMTNVKALEYVVENFAEAMPTEVAEKVEKILDSYRTKSTNRKPTKAQEENVTIKATILDVLREASKPLTITEIQAEDETLAGLTNQKISALLTQLGEKGTGEVVKTMDKKKAYFSVA